MNIHLDNAKRLLRAAVLPDRTLGAIVDQALRGTNKSTGPVLRGVGEDVFELVANPMKAAVELIKATRR